MTNFWKKSRFAAVVLPVVGFLALGIAPPAEAQSFQGLGDLPGGSTFSNANGVSLDGSVVVGSSTSASGSEAFRWTSGDGMVGLGDLPGGSFFSVANAVSSDGSVVVGRGTSASGSEAFIWDASNGMRNLKTVLEGAGVDMTGWTLIEARGVSADDTKIVGWGTNPLGDTEAWLADLTPGPGPALPAASHRSLMLMGIVLAVGGVLAIGRVRKALMT